MSCKEGSVGVRLLKTYRVRFFLAGRRIEKIIEALGVLDAFREVRAMYPSADKLEIERS